jgi:hypothetical protein
MIDPFVAVSTVLSQQHQFSISRDGIGKNIVISQQRCQKKIDLHRHVRLQNKVPRLISTDGLGT